MEDTAHRAVAIVGLGAVLPDAPDVATFWENVKAGRYSITETPSDRWNPDLYYDPDPKAPDKTYSKIGAWVRDWSWDPLAWKLPVPPRVADSMDRAQKWAVAAARQALTDYGWPKRPLDPERTAVVLGNAMAGDRHYLTATRLLFPEIAEELEAAPSFAALPAQVREAVERELRQGVGRRLPHVDEDTMPGELANIIAGRVANLFDFHGPNYVVDAACASAMAAISAAVEGLEEGDFDAVVSGGVDANMNASTFIKFCKIGALSGTGTRPFADGADGFVMGEGAALFVLKRLADAERDGDRIHAVIRGLGGASDGRGKGITAPNPVGQRLAVERAWARAGLPPATAGLIEGHGTSTRVGDVAEVESLTAVFGQLGLPAGSIPLGSVKSNIGHLKGAAGAAGILKSALSLRDRVLPPSLHCERTNPNIDFSKTPFAVNTVLRPWEARKDGEPRRAGVSAFGFGGTNFHTVLEEHVPGRLGGNGKRATVAVTRDAAPQAALQEVPAAIRASTHPRMPPGGALLLGAATEAGLAERLRATRDAAAAGDAPAPATPRAADLGAPERVALDFGDAAELAEKAGKALKALEGGHAGMWRALRAQGIFRGDGRPAEERPKAAFLYTGQGSQYLGMLGGLREIEPVVNEAFAEADRVMAPILGRPLTDYLFPKDASPEGLERAEKELRQTAITQPAVLTVDIALTRLLADHGIAPDLVMGHSLGEYGALVAAGCLSFAEALEAVAARGREMTRVSVADNGRMIAVFAPLEEIERTLEAIHGDAVIANYNSTSQAVVGGSTEDVTRAEKAFREAGREVRPLPVSHAFHTHIVAPASAPLREMLRRLDLRPPEIPIVANVTGELYPMGPGVVPEMIEILGQQIAAPVRFVQGLETLYREGARVFVEVGPKRALHGFVEDVLGRREGVTALFTNHPKSGDLVSLNHALCGLFAAGLGTPAPEEAAPPFSLPVPTQEAIAMSPQPPLPAPARPRASDIPADRYTELGHLFADVLERGFQVLGGGKPLAGAGQGGGAVVVTGAALGLPGAGRVFDDANPGRILRGEQAIDAVPLRLRRQMVEKNVTRLVKSDEGGGPRFETIDSPAEVIKLAARAGEVDLTRDFGIPEDRLAAFDRVTRLAVAAGLDALRDAGIPLVLRYKTATTGARLPDRWGLPDSMRDDTGVIFASAFPGADSLVEIVEGFHEDKQRRERRAELQGLKDRLAANGAAGGAVAEIDRRIREVEAEIARNPYTFDRRFLFRVLSMGHSQFAELIGARGPNTQINAACASTTQAFSLAEDWIRAGRCRRVVVIAADDITSDRLLGWFGAGFLASGAAATDELVEDAALPFDRRRHGLIIGMGAAAAVVESAEAARERGLAPICEVLGTATANSAFHGSRLDVQHIGGVMEKLVADAESRWGIDRHQIAPETVFLSHETYTPARGGSAQAEVEALRRVFGPSADRIVIANTKGYTGHPMAVGIEDVVAVKSLETGLVPPVANIKELDPELAPLNLSRGGAYPVRYALRLGAGFGSQISLSLLRWVPTPTGVRPAPEELGFRHRIADPEAWQAFLAAAGGDPEPHLEVVGRTLRVADRGLARAVPAREKPAPAVAAPAPAPAPVAVAAPAPEPARPEPQPEPQPEPARPAEDDGVREAVLALVAEKTGYPVEMLDLDLDLEADLGVDTVKQAEVFAAIRERWGIPRDENLKLRDFPTLAHTLEFVYSRRPDLRPGAAPATAEPAAAPEAPAAEATAAEAPETAPAVEIPRRIPIPVLRPPLDLCKPTGVTLGPGSRVVVFHDRRGIGRSLVLRLQKLGVETLELEGAPSAAELEERLRGWQAEGPVQGVYWLPALDREEDLGEMDLAGWREAARVRVKLLATALRTLYDGFAEPGSFLVAGTRLGGRHGYGEEGAVAPLGGGVSGLAKAFRRERPEALVKVVDFPAGRQSAGPAEALIEEALRDPGAVEIGREGARRWAVGLAEQPAGDGPGLALGKDTVFVVTGAAGSIVSAIVEDLAAASGGTFHLLDLTPEPDPADPDLAKLATGRDGLKRDLFERLQAAGERATPARIEKELARLERAEAGLAAIQAVRAAGGEAVWHRADLRDAEAVAAAMDAVTRAHGRVDVLVHAAGLEISRFLPDKSPEEFDLVFDVKADGWFNLLRGLEGLPLGAAVVFSSVAGRFGNGGQADYSAANDLLCKSVSSLRRTRPETFGIAIDWTAWGGIGMATRGSIPRMMEAAGIDMLPPAEGIPVVRRELTAGTRGEIVVAGRLGVMTAELDETGGLDLEAANALLRRFPVLGRATGFTLYGGLAVEAVLDPAGQPFLDDHRIDGTPVLPGVMGLEAFAELATAAFPDLRVEAVEDAELLAPFKLYRDEPRTAFLHALFRGDGDGVVAICRLLGRRALPGQETPQVTTHFTARVRLVPAEAPATAGPGEAPAVSVPRPDGAPTLAAEDVYRVYFHGPAYRVLDRAWRHGEAVAGLMASGLPPNHRPEESPTVLEPRLIELCFQTAGVGELGERGRMALPLHVDRVATLRHPPAGTPLYAVAVSEGEATDALVVDEEGTVYVILTGYRTVPLPGGLDPALLEPFREALSPAGRPQAAVPQVTEMAGAAS